MKNIQIDNKPYSSGVMKKDLFQTVVEPTTGFVIMQRRALSVFVNLQKGGSLPFPGLDNLG
jgi:hypothetical protein